MILASTPSHCKRLPLRRQIYDDHAKEFFFFRSSDSEVSEFIKRKVYWLGFRVGGRNSEVWIADPYRRAIPGYHTDPHAADC